MCDVACCKVQTPGTRYRKYHWKLSLRPIFSKLRYKEPYPLTKKLLLIPDNPGYENSTLQTLGSKTVAELKFNTGIRASGEVLLDGKVYSFRHEGGDGGVRIVGDGFRAFARRVRLCSRVLELQWGIQKLRIVPTHPWRKEFVVCVVEQEGKQVDTMKVIEIVRTDSMEKYNITFVEFAKLELVACAAWLSIVVNRS